MSPLHLLKMMMSLALVSSLVQPAIASEMKTVTGEDGVERLVDPRTGHALEAPKSKLSDLQDAAGKPSDKGGFFPVKSGGGSSGGSSSGGSRSGGGGGGGGGGSRPSMGGGSSGSSSSRRDSGSSGSGSTRAERPSADFGGFKARRDDSSSGGGSSRSSERDSDSSSSRRSSREDRPSADFGNFKKSRNDDSSGSSSSSNSNSGSNKSGSKDESSFDFGNSKKSKRDDSSNSDSNRSSSRSRRDKNDDRMMPGQSTQAANINAQANKNQPIYSNQYSKGERVRNAKGQEVYQKTDKRTGEVTQFGQDSKGRNFQTTIDPNSGRQETRVAHKDGKGFSKEVVGPNGQKAVESIRVRADGTTAKTKNYVDPKSGMHVTELPSGGRRLNDPSTGKSIYERPDRSRVERQGGYKTVYNSRGERVYSENRYTRNGNTYIQRTTVYNNHTYVSSYHPYSWGGYYYNSYTPFFWYPSAYYSYIYHPWANPYTYSWGYVPYNYYFTPYVTYSHPLYWLTDYMLIEALSDAAQARNAARPATPTQAATDASTGVAPGQSKTCTTSRGGWMSESKETCTVTAAAAPVAEISEATLKPAKATPIKEETKQEIKTQLEGLIKLHQEKQSVTLSYAMDNKLMVNVREDEKDFKGTVLGADGQPSGETCDFASGDLVRFTSSMDAGAVVMTVVASRGEGCDAGDKVILSGEQAQDLLNLYSQTLEKGLAKMQKDDQLKQAGVPTDAPQVNAQEEQPATQPTEHP